MQVGNMILPIELVELIALGKWPAEAKDSRARGLAINRQQTNPLVSADRVRALAPDETLIILFPPPFKPLEGKVSKLALPDFVGAPDNDLPPGDLDFSRCVDIGDFGLGSDSPIVLDYRFTPENPPVLRLRWERRDEQNRNRWVIMTDTFREFAQKLGLWG